MTFADAALARRLEAAEAANAAEYGSDVLEIGGGCAVFAGLDSPLTQAVGLGLNGRIGAADMDRLEEFFDRHRARVSVDCCPLADPGLIEELRRRGYGITDFSNVLVKLLRAFEVAPTPRVRRVFEGEGDLWACAVGQGFFERPELSEEEMDIGRTIFRMRGAHCYLAVSDSGEPAAGAAATLRSGLATLFADGTIPRFRRQGLHRELILARLNEASAEGCDIASASTHPGSGSQQNYERLGFEVAYTRFTLVREL